MPKPRAAPLPGHFCVIQTGPWEGPGSWCHRIYCLPCGFDDLATCWDDAEEARDDHSRQVEAGERPLIKRDDEIWEDV
jgi:hypothetical protein